MSICLKFFGGLAQFWSCEWFGKSKLIREVKLNMLLGFLSNEKIFTMACWSGFFLEFLDYSGINHIELFFFKKS